MEQFTTSGKFNDFLSGKSYVHLSEDFCASISAFIVADDTKTLDVLRYAGEYLVDKGDADKTYEVVSTCIKGITKLRESQSGSEDSGYGKTRIIARYHEPYWVFLMNYEG